MKKLRFLGAIVLAGAALFLMTSIVAAAPATDAVRADRANSDPVYTGTVTNTVAMTQPVAAAIAAYFHISYTEVISLHESGFGFGVIARAYLTALHSNGVLSPTDLLDMFQSGMGWGQIMKEYGVHPGGNGLGTIMRSHGVPVAVVPPVMSPPDTQSGKSNNGQSKDASSAPSSCPGNSCNAPGHNKSGQSRKP